MEPQDTNQLSRRIAVLIDGDNAQPSLIREMLAETSKFGRITIRRIYGDWTTSNMNGWKESLQANAIQPMQQFRYTVGKNATDSAMIIDALDILHSTVVDGFCLVSSDSDYTRLAMRIREAGLFVMGVGRKVTPQAFRGACEIFVYTENLAPQSAVPATTPQSLPKPTESTPVTEPLPTLKKAVEISAQEDGWAHLGALGSKIRSIDPSFDSRTYGFPGLKSLIASYPAEFRLKEIKQELGSSFWVRLK